MMQLNKNFRLLSTIKRAGRITFEEINDKWRDNVELSGGRDMSLRNFHRWRNATEGLFYVNIAWKATW